MQLATD